MNTAGLRPKASGPKVDAMKRIVFAFLLVPSLATAQDAALDIGPCVSQRIIEEQGGSLKARREREGVIFHARFPLARERAK